MGQISGALVGVALVLSRPCSCRCAFIGGSSGVIYRQFSITIVSAMVLSVLVAITLTPALCATHPRAHSGKGAKHGKADGGLFGRVQPVRSDRGNANIYEGGVKRVVRWPIPFGLVYALILAALAYLFLQVPTSFLPDEDQGIMFVQVTTPPGATVERTEAVLDRIREYFMGTEKAVVDHVFTVTGFSFGGRGQSSGLAFVDLKPWSQRPGAKNRAQAIARRAMGYFQGFKDAMAFAFVPPAVLELGNATGFDAELVDRGNLGHQALMNARNQFLGEASKQPQFAPYSVRPNGLDDEPQYSFSFDRERASAYGLTIADINNTLSDAWGSGYVNQFLDRGRIKRVFIQGRATSRMLPEDFNAWYVRNSQGQMVPFSAFSEGKWTFGSPKLERYNGTPSVEILGSPANGVSTGEAMKVAESLAAKLPPGIALEWTGLSYEEQRAGSQTTALYAISLAVVFLCLAALYESWVIPFAVMLVVPLGVFGAVLATLFRGLDNDVFFQVGLLTTIGLSAKNAILIVEFAKENYDSGMNLIDATVRAAHQRLRPILMTSLAFILGVLPLAISSGAGSGGQNAIGTGVIGGMFSATVLAIFFVPLFFVAMLRLFRVKPWVPRGDLPADEGATPSGARPPVAETTPANGVRH